MQWFNNQGRPVKIMVLGGTGLLLYLCFFGTVVGLSRTSSASPTVIARATPAPSSPSSTPLPTPPPSPTARRAETATAIVAPLTPTAPATRTVHVSATAHVTRTARASATARATATTLAVSEEATPLTDPAAFNALRISTAPASESGIRVALTLADGTLKSGAYVAIHEQVSDVSGNPALGRRLHDGYTDNNGTVFFPLESGTYALQVQGNYGYPWPYAYHYEVASGQATVVEVTLGRLQIGVVDEQARPLEGKWTGVYLQQEDINGQPTLGARIADGYTANTGSVSYDLLPGLYGVQLQGIAGYLWGKETDHPVLPGQTTKVVIPLGRLTVGVRDADQEPVQGNWVGIYLQTEDVNGNAAKDRRILDGYTDNTGTVSWNVTEGSYGVEIQGLRGKLWGEEVNHTVTSGEVTQLTITLGRLTVAVTDSSGKPISGQWVGAYYQEQDVSGSFVKGERFLDGYTDDTGLISWNVTEGNYVVEVNDQGTILDVPVRSGATTVTDGTSILSGP